MEKDKVPFFSLIIFIVLVIFACKGSVEPIIEGEYNYVAVTATINNQRQIVLVDYDDPSRFKQITFNDHQNVYPKFSHDRTKLVIGDKKMGFTHTTAIVYYDLNIGYLTPINLDTLVPGVPYPLTGDNVVWDLSDDIIYFRIKDQLAQSYSNIAKYDFISSEWSKITNTQDNHERPISIFDENTLVIFSNDTATHEPLGYYLFNMNGTYQSRINNPHLELINRDGINLKAAYNPEYNCRNGLFVYANVDSSFEGFKIAVTNLDGTYYVEYTNGDYIDDHPSWGPDDNIIFFDRVDPTDYSGSNSKVMVLDINSGEVWELVEPAVLNGASALSLPDY